MEQPCSRCGYISDRPARFCRQCGSQLFAENEATSATTRNYAPQTPPQFAEPQAGHSGYAPGGWAEQTPNTSRFYQPPAVPQYEQPIAPQKSSWVKWVLLSFAGIFLLCVIFAVGIIYWASQKAGQVIEQAQREIPVEIEIPQPRDIPFPPDAPAAPESATTLDNFKYPGATTIKSEKVPFVETVTMTTSDDLEKVKEFYDKKFAETFKDSNTDIQVVEEEKLVYTSVTHPMIIIEAKPDNQSDKTRITLTRMKASIPNIKLPKEIKIN
jgi:hypothetical protein